MFVSKAVAVASPRSRLATAALACKPSTFASAVGLPVRPAMAAAVPAPAAVWSPSVGVCALLVSAWVSGCRRGGGWFRVAVCGGGCVVSAVCSPGVVVMAHHLVVAVCAGFSWGVSGVGTVSLGCCVSLCSVVWFTAAL